MVGCVSFTSPSAASKSFVSALHAGPLQPLTFTVGDPPSMMLVKEANKAGPETRLIVEQIAIALLTRLTVDERERLAKLLEAEGQACE